MRTNGNAVVATIVLAAALSVSRAAVAEETFGRDGQAILSADRLFGLSFGSAKFEQSTSTFSGNGTTSRTDIDLFWAAQPTTPYEIPRFAFDYVVRGGVTVGGSVAFLFQSGSDKSEMTVDGRTTSANADAPSLTSFAVAPRVGYLFALGPSLAFWPRAGVTYYSLQNGAVLIVTGSSTSASSAKDTSSGLGLNLEPMFVYSPVAHFGIAFGPVVDLPLSANASQTLNRRTRT